MKRKYIDENGTLTIPEGVERIRSEAYKNCAEIKRVVLPKSLRLIGRRAFQGCENLCEIVSNGGLTHINDFAFSNCWNLRALTLPDTLARVGHHAFYGCGKLTGFRFGKSVKSVKSSAFERCVGISAYTVDGANPYLQAVDGVLYSKDGEKLLAYPRGKTDGKCVVIDGTKEVCAYAFQGNDYLVSVKFPDGLSKIGERAFQYCSSLQAVNIPASLRKMGQSAFYDCPRVKQVHYKGDSLRWRAITNGLNTFSWKANPRVYAKDESFLHC